VGCDDGCVGWGGVGWGGVGWGGVGWISERDCQAHLSRRTQSSIRHEAETKRSAAQHVFQSRYLARWLGRWLARRLARGLRRRLSSRLAAGLTEGLFAWLRRRMIDWLATWLSLVRELDGGGGVGWWGVGGVHRGVGLVKMIG
jgi:hypothetical protein